MQRTRALTKSWECSPLTASEHYREWHFKKISGDDDFPIEMPCGMTQNRQGE